VSEEVVIVDEVFGDPMFVLRLDSCIALFDEPNARNLRDRLNGFLGADKQDAGTQWEVGDFIEAHSAEPDLPIGSLIQDHSSYRDIAEKVEDGWKWVTLLGDRSRSDDRPWNWLSWEEQKWTVIRVGK
jgi:hypothetical protein